MPENALSKRGQVLYDHDRGEQIHAQGDADGEMHAENSEQQRGLSYRQLFRRERSENFLKARIVADWIPDRVEPQFAITEVAWNFGGCGKLSESSVLLSGQRVGERQVLDDPCAVDRVFCHRKKLRCSLRFTICLSFISKLGVDYTEHAKGGRIIVLLLDYFFYFRVRGGERGASVFAIASGTSDNTFAPRERERERFVATSARRHHAKCTRSLVPVAFIFGELQRFKREASGV